TRHQRHPRHHRLRERVQQLRPPTHHTVPLLTQPRQVPRHVHHHDQRHTQRIAHPHEPGRLLRALRVQTPTQPPRIVRDHPHRPTREPAKRRHHVRRPLG